MPTILNENIEPLLKALRAQKGTLQELIAIAQQHVQQKDLFVQLADTDRDGETDVTPEDFTPAQNAVFVARLEALKTPYMDGHDALVSIYTAPDPL